MQEYRVLAQSDSYWSDRFSPQLLQGKLNELAREGWRVVTCATTEFTGLGGLGSKRHELFVLLEREHIPGRSDGTPGNDCKHCGASGTVNTSGFCLQCKKKQ